ncbi:hypothetical protein PUN28_006678 [Cardiocondyla obscurior]|uniref:Uncharacterized protein n=1 Tax=Cardiocondyla obscurior TaxID=286306 RepID=A0AAW2FZ77_9HYME
MTRAYANRGGILQDRSSRPLCGRRPERSRRARRPRCSGPWPSCYRRRSARTRSCPAGISGRTVLNEPRPSSRAPNRPESRAARIYRPSPRCNKHLFSPAGDPSRRDMCRWDRFRARPRSPPRTVIVPTRVKFQIDIIFNTDVSAADNQRSRTRISRYEIIKY